MKKFILVFLLLSGCAQVAIKNEEFCGDLGSQGASCFFTLSSQTEDIPKAIWDIDRFGMICEEADVFADWKTYIEQLCTISHDCSFETQQQITSFFKRVDEFKAKRDALIEQAK
jgi:hypothetical protein